MDLQLSFWQKWVTELNNGIPGYLDSLLLGYHSKALLHFILLSNPLFLALLLPPFNLKLTTL